jgi:hypothetical protein
MAGSIGYNSSLKSKWGSRAPGRAPLQLRVHAGLRAGASVVVRLDKMHAPTTGGAWGSGGTRAGGGGCRGEVMLWGVVLAAHAKKGGHRSPLGKQGISRYNQQNVRMCMAAARGESRSRAATLSVQQPTHTRPWIAAVGARHCAAGRHHTQQGVLQTGGRGRCYCRCAALCWVHHLGCAGCTARCAPLVAARHNVPGNSAPVVRHAGMPQKPHLLQQQWDHQTKCTLAARWGGFLCECHTGGVLASMGLALTCRYKPGRAAAPTHDPHAHHHMQGREERALAQLTAAQLSN